MKLSVEKGLNETDGIEISELESTVSWKRSQEYPSIKDQLDEIYHNGIDSWKAIIKVTKDKYPK